jgi:hypothetical protein
VPRFVPEAVFVPRFVPEAVFVPRFVPEPQFVPHFVPPGCWRDGCAMYQRAGLITMHYVMTVHVWSCPVDAGLTRVDTTMA